MTYFMEPWESWGVEAGSPAAAVKALAQNNLEWAWGQYAQYGIFAMALGIAIYNYKQPSRASSFLYLINGKPANKKINNIVDILCLFRHCFWCYLLPWDGDHAD